MPTIEHSVSSILQFHYLIFRLRLDICFDRNFHAKWQIAEHNAGRLYICVSWQLAQTICELIPPTNKMLRI